MQVIGVDFGTTNVRIATWDSGSDLPPQPLPIGQVGGATMPAVIAFLREPGGNVQTIVGEEADRLSDGPDTVVLRNIKRWALSKDRFVAWHLESKKVDWPTWWNPDSRSVNVWGQDFPVKDLMKQILGEAFRRARDAGLTDDFEWRAGCPVHAGLDYRTDLAEIMGEFGKGNKVSSVIEEPILFLVLAHKLGKLTEGGSYLVFDVGGGSFDCALAEVESANRMVVYAAHGDPLLGGTNIDDMLREELNYTGPRDLLRLAKESLTLAAPTQVVPPNTNLSLTDLEKVLKESHFLDYTTLPMREVYISAKIVWKCEEPSPIATRVPSCRLGQLPAALDRDLDGIIIFGGPTKSPVFRDWLFDNFGVGNIKLAEDLLPDITDPHLTGLSMGACYADPKETTPLVTNRLPAKVTLRNTSTGEKSEYLPYQHFAKDFNPIKPFVSETLPPQTGAAASYELVVADADGDEEPPQPVNVVHPPANAVLARMPGVADPDENLRPGVRSPRLIIDTLGRVCVGNIERHWAPNERWWVENERRWIEIDAPPWQTGWQREVLNDMLSRQKEFEESERERVHGLITQNPYGWQSGHG